MGLWLGAALYPPSLSLITHAINVPMVLAVIVANASMDVLVAVADVVLLAIAVACGRDEMLWTQDEQ